MGRWVLIAAAVAVPGSVEAAADQAPVSGFPETTEHERDLIGIGRGISRGRWTVNSRGVTLEKRHGYGANLWFPQIDGPIADGTLRARFESDRRMDFTLLFRCEFDQLDIENFRGYGLAVSSSTARFVRYDGGLYQGMGPGIKLPELADRASVEVVVTQVGPHITAQLFDGTTLESIGVLSVAAKRYMKGRVGIRGGVGLTLSRFTVVRAGVDHRVNLRAFSGTRVVEVARRALAASDGTFDAWIAAREGNNLFLRLPPVQYERLIRSGVVPISVSDHIPWRFVDPVYAAARNREDEAPRFGYKNSSMVESSLRGLEQAFPELCETVSIGQTSHGREIWALRISQDLGGPLKKPVMLIDGAQHGVELWATEYVLDVARFVLESRADPRVTAWINNLDIWLIPLANPDGRDAFMEVSHLAGRKNFRDVNGDGVAEPREGVDINRNFPFAWGRFGERGSRTIPHHNRYRGEAAASEAESQALMKLARDIHPSAVLSVHTKGTVLLPPYATRGVKQTRLDEAWQIAEAMTAATPRQMNGRRYRLRRRLYPVDGVWKDWLRHEFGTLAMVIEGPYHNPLDPSVVRQTVEESRPIWQTLFDRSVNGPLVYGWTVDGDDEPVPALVEVVENMPQAGEKWFARPDDGFFMRYLVSGAKQTLRISAPGFETQTVSLSTDAPTVRKFVLTKRSNASAH
ncbi:MAG: M14 family zinc carboxypeptidase [Myxococcota bacterium]